MAIPRQSLRPNYGIDAPNVIRNLLLAAFIGIAVWVGTMLAASSGRFDIPRPILAVTGIGFTTGIGCGLMAGWMLWDSRIGKLRSREKLLDRISWSGNEQVLDVGCGRGLLLNGAAKRLNTGRAIGIDIWQAEDLTGNNPAAALENARLEQVPERVSVQTGDMRRMPFGDGTFDVVVSGAAIHNLYKAEDRTAAIREIARVLKPGGRAVIEDIRHGSQYALTFSQNGCKDIRRVDSALLGVLLMLITFGSMQPATLVVRKD